MAKSKTFLASSPGKVVALSEAVTTATLRLDNFGGFDTFRAIVTQVAISDELAAKFQNMLGGNIYVYVFGEKPGGMMVRGIAMESGCDDDEGDVKGIRELRKYYNENSALARQTPLKLTIGTDLTIVCYLVGIQYSVADPKLHLWEFSLRFVTIPESSIAANRRRKAALDAATDDADDTSSSADGPVLPPVDPAATDQGGANMDDVFQQLPAGQGYSIYGTGPTLDLVESQ